MATTMVFGSTGVVGSHILTTVLATDTFKAVETISRRAPKAAEHPEKLHAIIEADTTQWAPTLRTFSPAPHTVFSSVGTTRAAAGGIAEQWKIDHDLNVELAKAAKENGAHTFVFISSAGTRKGLSAMLPYAKMKVGVEEAVREQGFESAIILRPGLIMDAREVEHANAPLIKAVVRGLGRISKGLQDAMSHDGEVIARAAVRAAQLAREGKAPEKFWVLEGAEINRLGRTEWQSS